MGKERIDKLISSQSMMTRSDATKIIRSGIVTVNGTAVRSTSFKADPSVDDIKIGNVPFVYKKHIYIMMNKPDGIVSASRDPKEKTVIDIVPDELKRPNLFPAGRLDKDTTGFVLITDDGDFAHNILSPKHHVEKTYLAETSCVIEDSFLDNMRNGMMLGDEQLMEAEIELIQNEKNPVYKIVLREGKYHQIKRMIGSTNAELLSLKRIKMGNLPLDETLSAGECREITAKELSLITEKRN